MADYTGSAGQPAVQGRSSSGPGGAFSSTAGPAALAANRAPDQPTVRATNADLSLTSVAVQGYAAGGTADRVHPGGGFYSAGGEFCGANGVIGAASPASSTGYGVVGLADNAFGIGVYARGSNGAKALVAVGDVDVLGTLTKSGGSFRIDHPLAPATKYLSHSFVESPDMKNIYDGVVTTDADGTATVVMPDWFDALNRDLRYQLTALGGPAPGLHVAAELEDLRFTVAGAQPHQRISWQVTGTRRDAWAEANRIPVEEDKPASARGRFLHPEALGRDASLGLDDQSGA